MAQQPMYQQIADIIRREIEKGEDGKLPPGEQLPTEQELRTEYNASRNTVRDAIKLLISMGLVETRPGQGTFVTRQPDPFVTTLSKNAETGFGGGEGASRLSALVDPETDEEQPTASIPEVKFEIPEPWMRRRLRVPPDVNQVIVRAQERYIKGVPWSLQKSYYPMGFLTRGATKLIANEDIQPGTVSYLTESIGVRQTGYRDWIVARRPSPEEQAFFGVVPESTVLEVTRTGFDQDKQPFRVTVSVFPAEQNQFIYDIGDDLPEPQYDDRPPGRA